MSTYCSMGNVPLPDGAVFFDIAYDCFGRDVRIILDGRSCYPTAAEAREIATAFQAAAARADECTLSSEGGAS